MSKEKKYSITMRTLTGSIDDINTEVMAIDPVKAIEKAITIAKQKYPELASDVINFVEINLIS